MWKFILILSLPILNGCQSTNDKLIEQTLLKIRNDYHQEQLDKQHRRDLETLTTTGLVVRTSSDSRMSKSMDSGRDYITIGSSKADVIRIHGTPKGINKISDHFEMWNYPDYSLLNLSNGKVESWHNNGFLNVRM